MRQYRRFLVFFFPTRVLVPSSRRAKEGRRRRRRRCSSVHTSTTDCAHSDADCCVRFCVSIFVKRGADLPSNMGRDSSSAITGKRSRVVEDEIYYDNYHVHKRYLTEVGYSCFHYTSFHGSLWLISKVHSARLHVVEP
jgi:hypothetical protein